MAPFPSEQGKDVYSNKTSIQYSRGSKVRERNKRYTDQK